MMANIFNLNRFKGSEEYGFEQGTIKLFDIQGKKYIHLMVETTSVQKSLEDTEEFGALPVYGVYIPVENYDRFAVGAVFPVEVYSEDLNNFLNNFYYCEHQEVNDNVIRVVQKRGDAYLLEITGNTVDVCYYGGSKPETVLEIAESFLPDPEAKRVDSLVW